MVWQGVDLSQCQVELHCHCQIVTCTDGVAGRGLEPVSGRTALSLSDCDMH